MRVLVVALAVSSPTVGAAQDYGVAPAGEAAIAASCVSELTPDRLVITGAMTAEGVKPLAIRELLDKQLEALRGAADRLGARLILGERVRAARSGSRTPRDAAPLVFAQPIELELPAEADADQVLDAILPLGVDRLGPPDSSVVPPRLSGSRDLSPIVSYRFSSLAPELDRIHQNCRRAAFERWCAAREAAEPCVKALGTLAPLLPTRSLVLVADPPGGSPGSQATLVYPWTPDRLKPLTTILTRTLSLTGQIVVAFPGSR